VFTFQKLLDENLDKNLLQNKAYLKLNCFLIRSA